jgi:hypothetical protein
VLNARTGSVVMNDAVTLGPCAVAHGSLSVTISHAGGQPARAAVAGQTVVAEKADIAITQQGGSLIQMPAGAKLADVVKALNALGATPQDLLAILQAMKQRRRAARRDRGDLMMAVAASLGADGRSLDALQAAPRATPRRRARSGAAVRVAVHAGADEEHARRHAEPAACSTTRARKLGTEMLDTQQSPRP